MSNLNYIRRIQPVEIAEPELPPTKTRRVTIIKQKVYDDIEAFAFKYADAATLQSKVENAVTPDVTEKLDGATVARYVKFRDAKLRKHISAYLAESENPITEQDDYLPPAAETSFVYDLEVAQGFKDALLDSVAEYFHRFLVWGALRDWYAVLGLEQASVYQSELDHIEREITGLLVSPSYAKRPLQPFGPANKIF